MSVHMVCCPASRLAPADLGQRRDIKRSDSRTGRTMPEGRQLLSQPIRTAGFVQRSDRGCCCRATLTGVVVLMAMWVYFALKVLLFT